MIKQTTQKNAPCDLHVHSTASDGSCTPEELVAIALRQGLSAVALTDHNTLAGLARFEAAALGTDLATVPGVEVTAGYADKEVHILGLFIPLDAREALSEFLAEIDRRKRAANRMLMDALSAAGYAIDLPAVLRVAGEATPNRVHIANVLMQRGYVASIQEAFDTLIRDGGGFYRAPERLDALQVVDFMRSHGILPVAAHPLLTLSRDEVCDYLSRAKACGLAGVETLYPLYSTEEAAFMAEVADRLGLFPCGGSDFHGANKPDIQIGSGMGDLVVPYAVFEDLRDHAEEFRRPPLTGTIHPLHSFPVYKYVVICTFLQGKLLLSRHKKRRTWETQGGHIESGEAPLDAARRELYEESGIRDAEIIPICDYCGYRGTRFSHGVFFVAIASTRESLPASEIAEVRIFDALPEAEHLTYPLMTPLLYEEARKMM